MKAMILAAGRGTRLKPLTNNKPKALVEVNGTPMIGLLIERLKQAGFNEILINIHHFGDQIVNYVKQHDHFGANITFSDERNQLLDTGGALLKAAPFFKGDEPVLLHNVDIISQIDLNELSRWFHQSGAVAGLVVRNRDTHRKLLFNNTMKLSGWKNRATGESKYVGSKEKDLTEYAYSGIWICTPQFPGLIPFKGRFSIVDVWLTLASEHVVTGFLDNSPLWFDLGTPEKITEAEKYLCSNG